MKAHKKKRTGAKQQPILDRKNDNSNNSANSNSNSNNGSQRNAKHSRDDDTDPTPGAAAPKVKKKRTTINLKHLRQALGLNLRNQSTSNNNNRSTTSERAHVQPLTPTPATTRITDTPLAPGMTTTIPRPASKKSVKQELLPPLQKKDKHVAVESLNEENHIANTTASSKITTTTTNRIKSARGSSSIRIITQEKDTDPNLPPTPPTSASLEGSGEKKSTTAAVDLDGYKGYTDEEWFARMGWHFEEESGDLDFVDRHGKLFDYEECYDRFEFVQAKIQSLVHDRLRDKYGFQQIAVAQNQGTSAPAGGEYHRFPQIFVSPDIHTNTTVLVLVPKVGDEAPGQWDRAMFTSGERGNILFASQFPYIDMALNQGWGVVLCDPNGGDVHDSDEYRQSHILYVWDDILRPSQAKCVMYVALGEGTDAVLSILDSSRADEFRQRVKGVALLDGTNGDKWKEKLDRAWLNKHARSFMAKNGTSPGRNGTKVNAADEHELVPGYALKGVFAFLRNQNSMSKKAQALVDQQQAKSGRKSSATTTTTTNGKSTTATTSHGNKKTTSSDGGSKSSAQPTPEVPSPPSSTPSTPPTKSDNSNSRNSRNS